MITSVIKLPTSWGQFFSFIFYIFPITWMFYFVFKWCINLIFTVLARPLLVFEACNPFSLWGKFVVISFSTSYIAEVFNAFALRPHNMLAVLVIKQSVDQDWNRNKVVSKFRIWIILFKLAWELVCIMTSVDL